MKWAFLFFLSASVSACPPHLLSKLAQLNAELPDLAKALFSLDVELLSGRKKPTWQDLENIRQLRDRIQITRDLKIDITPLVPELVVAADALEKSPLANPTTQHGPTEYGLKTEYQRLIADINRLLPRELRIAHARIRPDPRDAKWTQRGRDIVRGIEAEFPASFATTGFVSPFHFRKAVKEESFRAQELWEDLENEQFDVVVHRPVAGRWWIPRVGFHNQFVTGSSNGTFNNDLRNSAEAAYLGKPVGEYAVMDARDKAKYGRLAPKLGSDLPDMSRNWYGDDMWVLDLEKIRDRLTWAPTDSLGRRPAPGSSRAWDKHFVPWSSRELMLPYLLDGYKRGVLQPTDKVLPGFKDQGHPSGIYGYLETQIWGDLTLDHVKAFVFTTSPPEGEFLEALRAKNIPIYDKRNGGKPELWTGTP